VFIVRSDVQQIVGTYRSNPVIHYYDPGSKQNVITKLDGTFVSGWTLSADQAQNLEDRSSL
jgi:hypothetical protein